MMAIETMKQNTSAQRQNELLSELLSLASTYADQAKTFDADWRQKSERLNSQFEQQLAQLSRSILIKRDETENQYQAHVVALREDIATRTKIVKNEFDEKLNAANAAGKKAKSDGEYDSFLAKQRLNKEYEADKLATRDSYKKKKAHLKAHGAEYAELASLAKAVLSRHACELKVQGGDLLEDPGEGDHLAAHRETGLQIHELIRQFRKTFWVHFQEDRWFLIVFMLGTVASVYPLHLWLGNLAYSGVAAALVGVVWSIVSYFVSKSLATKAAQQFAPSFVTAIATGKKQLLAAQDQNKKRRDTQLERLTKDAKQRGVEIEAEWKQTVETIETRVAQREKELRTWIKKQGSAIAEQKAAKESAIDARFQPQLNELQQNLDIEQLAISQTQTSELASGKDEYDAKKAELDATFARQTDDLRRELQRMVDVAASSVVDLSQNFDDFQPPNRPHDVVRFGRVLATLDTTPAISPTGKFGQLELPAAVDLLHKPALIVETNGTSRNAATNVLKSTMLRLLTAIPAGKLRFTIIDPIGLGQDFSAFMHLGDHDEQLINHRIWTESGHINSRLAEHTQHMENVIQTYLRNEFQSIQEYNTHAGEVAEAFRILVVANFPAGFSDEAASRLLSVVSSGPRCGVYTLMSIDPSQKLPRNFDLEDLRQHGNVLIANEEDVRWADKPLNEYSVELDELPSEAKFSEIMHSIGRQAKDASRVEVPFSAVAPDEDDWWKADGRGELSVSLGRAGATKQQSLKLGHGTSQHVLISGKTGSGKSTLLHAIIVNLSLKYSPDEVQFYLIDFKKGVEFKSYAEHQLPHAKVIAIESEREFGQSVLQRLDSELRRRGDLFRRVGVQSIAGYRDARPDEKMPRVMLVIDEFQEFFVKEDKIAQEASLLLDRLVRQGRAFGIHVLLGSQTLAGAYSLARATLGQMAVRIALQCSATDAHLILSDDNDAARLLRRPGEAIYNDANGMVEGNHPFQVVWLSDLEKENYLRQINDRQQATNPDAESPIVFEGNVAAEVSRNELLKKSWEAPAPSDIPLAPRAWLGEAIAIKEAPATVFHRRSGTNVLLVGQQEESALGVMASSLLSLASFSPTSPTKRTRFVVLDGTRPESTEAGYWHRFKETTGLDISIIKPRDAVDCVNDLADEVASRHEQDDDDRCTTFLFIYNLSRFRELQKTEDDFGFGSFSEEKKASPAEQLASILREGPLRGVHTIAWSDTHTNLMRWIDRQSLRDIESRILFQMSATDSSNLMDSSAASQLGTHRAIFYSEDQGRAERFRPYGLPDDDFLLRVRAFASSEERASTRSNHDE